MKSPRDTKPVKLNYGTRYHKPISRRLIGFNLKKVASVLLPIVVVLLIYYPFSPAGIQSRNMAKARAHIPIIQSRISQDSRFKHIDFIDSTVGNGILRINGDVDTQIDLDALKKIVASTSPPITIAWSVNVSELPPQPATFKSAEK